MYKRQVLTRLEAVLAKFLVIGTLKLLLGNLVQALLGLFLHLVLGLFLPFALHFLLGLLFLRLFLLHLAFFLFVFGDLVVVLAFRSFLALVVLERVSRALEEQLQALGLCKGLLLLPLTQLATLLWEAERRKEVFGGRNLGLLRLWRLCILFPRRNLALVGCLLYTSPSPRD